MPCGSQQGDAEEAFKVDIQAFSLSECKYPMTVEFIAELTGNVVHTIQVTGPGVMKVPPLAGEHGPIGVRVTYGDGTVEQVGAP